MSFNGGNCYLRFSSFANAQLGQNLAVDIRSLSMGNAVTADPLVLVQFILTLQL